MQVLRVTLIFTTISLIKASESDKTIAEKCMYELGLTTESYGSKMINGTAYSDDIVKCVDACLLKSYGIMNNDGTFELDSVMKLISDYPDDQDVKRNIVEKCIAKKADNDCDTAHNMIMCMNEEMQKSKDYN